ncbi:hypothetical protein [Actinomyces sp.]|uniref:hypothetical protein n=1 Tax=Actinomyces sp. TaxID=29317 RepID=UPI0026DCA57B|nr:hypothetical protein [Actinomyces sp.]MDO4901410.1 hypothetical protein [Actinomyces sp.]
MWGAVGVFLFGLLIAVYWVLAMFTDTGPGEFARDISAEVGHKNNLSLTVPAAGLMAVFAAPLGIPAVAESGFGMMLGVVGGFFVLLILVSLLPITLPAWMYSEWHVEWRRRRRRERLARENSWRDTSRLEPEARPASERPASPDDV